MLGHRVYPMHLQYSSREYDCIVTFLKVSDISVPLQSRSLPPAGSPPGSGALPFQRFLKLTTLYGTGQQEIGEFQIAGSECDIRHRRTYKFVPTDSVSVTKLHIYVDEVCNSGLTGHVTIDLKEFIGDDDSEIYLEYPLSARSPRHHAKLQLVVQCKGPHVDENDDVLDMDLETFLYDEFPDSLLECPHKEREFEHPLRPAGSVGENNQDTVGQQQGCGPSSQRSLDGFQPKIGSLRNQDADVQQQECLPSSQRNLDRSQSKIGSLGIHQDAVGQQQERGPSSQCSLHEFQPNTVSGNEDAIGQQQGCGGVAQIPFLEDFDGDFLGLDTSFKDFVPEYAQTRPFLVTGGQLKKGKDRQMCPKKSHLHAAVFFAAGVTMQQRLQSFESNSLSASLKTQNAIDHGVSPINRSSRVLLRSQSDEFDVKRVLSSPEIPREVAITVVEKGSLSGQNLNEGARDSTPGSHSPESLQASTNEAKGRGPKYVQNPSEFVACPICSSAEFRIQTQDTLPLHDDLRPDDEVCDGSIETTRADDETQSLITGSSSKQPKRTAVVVASKILGILFIAGVSFVLGARGGRFLGGPWETCTDDSTSEWSEIQQMRQFKESINSHMSKANYDGRMGGRQASGSRENFPTSSPSTFVTDDIGLPGKQREDQRKIIALSSPERKRQAELRLHGHDSEDVREPDRTRANLDNNARLGVDSSPIIEKSKRIEQRAASGGTNSLHRRRGRGHQRGHEERVKHLFRRKMLIPLL